jgi:ribosomal protein L29
MAKKTTSTTKPNDQAVDLSSLRKELLKLQLEKYAGKLKNTRSIFHLRKDIARTLTKLKEPKNQP